MTFAERTRMLSTNVNETVWNALDRKTRAGFETKRTHLERALIAYIEQEHFETAEERSQLAEKYGIGEQKH